ncbi:MAG: cation:dicarboxylase symporter family transporter, partial [Saprospiraceae bacterium]|nr:cation:dicarboxylase symporter family transporter [Saprospiraceae bacterium]
MKLSKSLWFALLSVAVVAGLHLLPSIGVPMEPHVLTGARWWAVGALCIYGWQNRSLNTWILLSMVIGFEIGLDMGKAAKDFDVLSSIFIRMIKTVVGPLLFSTLVIAIAGQENAKQMGRIAVKAFTYFLLATSIALVVGLVAINYTKAGMGITPEPTDVQKVPASELQASIFGKKGEVQFEQNEKVLSIKPAPTKLDWKYTILHTFPENAAKMLYENAILQIVVFSLLFGLGLRQVHD